MASSEDSVPRISDMDSPGSSVSSSLQREYEELLKYAVVTPKIQVGPSIYDQSVTVKDVAVPPTFSMETNASTGSSSSSLSTTSVTTQSAESDAAEEKVKQLPSTPSIRVSFQGQGSLARDSLLREGKLRTLPL